MSKGSILFRNDLLVIMMNIKKIREQEKLSHVEIYTRAKLYEKGTWLEKPVKTVMDLLSDIENREDIRILDLGCGIGRNAIAIARHFQNRHCIVDCVDLLDVAVEKLKENAAAYCVSDSIRTYVDTIEHFPISANAYDYILAVSALEHVDCTQTFREKLQQIRNGIRIGGIVCLILNSGVREVHKETGVQMPAQFETNLPAQELLSILSEIFSGWTILKSGVKTQQYDIPRQEGICELSTQVVTFAAKK